MKKIINILIETDEIDFKATASFKNKQGVKTFSVLEKSIQDVLESLSLEFTNMQFSEFIKSKRLTPNSHK